MGGASPELADAGRQQAEESGTLAAGSVVAGRYRVERLIATGGMGEVYEVEDLSLGERVALKLIRPSHDMRQSIERFKREVQLARRVTHANVCRVFEFGHHVVHGTAGASEMLFLTMELLAGETLADRLQRCGPMTPDEARPIIDQMAAALAAAHEQGIVHRDFKSQNVMLVPDDGGERAVVTDFGIARQVKDPDSLGITQQGQVLGSPHYMSPEQILGKESDPRSDIYAFGVVAFEMVTGSRPFLADTATEIVVKKVSERPRRPRKLVPDLDTAWEKTILRCLERDPARRFNKITDVLRSLAGEVVAGPARLRMRYVVAAATAVVLAAVAAVLLLVGRRPDLGAQTESTARPSLAVLWFKNLGDPDAAWISTALVEMLRTELAAGDAVRTIPGESVVRMRLELMLTETDTLSRETLNRVHTILGADYVVLGSYLQLQTGTGELRLDYRLQDTLSGSVLHAAREMGTGDDLFRVVTNTGARLRSSLGIDRLAPEDEPDLRASMPADPEAGRLYAEGLARLRLFDAPGAGERLQQAAALAPEHPLIHSALAVTWAALGYDNRARQAAQQAFELSGDLPRQDRLLVEARFRELNGEWQRAIEIYEGLFLVFGDNTAYGLQLAAAQTAAGRPDDALQTVSDLRRLDPPAAADPRIDLAEADAAKALTRLEHQHRAAGTAAEAARQWEARLLYARARMSQCDALVNLGRHDQAVAACDEAREIFTTTGDRASAARVENLVAVSHAMQGDLESARVGFERSLTQFRATGDRRNIAKQLSNIGTVLKRQGQPQAARERFEEALALSREIADIAGTALALNNIATVRESLGDLEAALTQYQEAAELFGQAGAARHRALTLCNIGEVNHQLGRLDAAVPPLEESLALSRQLEDDAETARTLVVLARVHRDRGRQEQARAAARQALEQFADELSEEDADTARAIVGLPAGAEQQSPETTLVPSASGERPAPG